MAVNPTFLMQIHWHSGGLFFGFLKQKLWTTVEFSVGIGHLTLHHGHVSLDTGREMARWLLGELGADLFDEHIDRDATIVVRVEPESTRIQISLDIHARLPDHTNPPP